MAPVPLGISRPRWGGRLSSPVSAFRMQVVLFFLHRDRPLSL